MELFEARLSVTRERDLRLADCVVVVIGGLEDPLNDRQSTISPR